MTVTNEDEADVLELIRFIQEEVHELELLVEMMALAVTKDEMPENQQALLDRILS